MKTVATIKNQNFQNGIRRCLSGMLFLILLVTSNNVIAQKQLNHWWFGINVEMEWDCSGNYMINSTNNPVKAVAGSFTISDKDGDFLFHILPTDFNSTSVDGGIYDNTNTYMQLATGGPAEINLNSGSGANDAIAVPVGSNVWYAFYSHGISTNSYDLNYSRIDMSLPGNGTAANPSGEVTSHLNSMGNANRQGISAVRHANGTDYWLLVKKINTIEAYQVSLAGGVSVPIISSVTLRPAGATSQASTGKLAFSADGSKAAWAYGVVDFDISTGLFSNDFILTQSQEFGNCFSSNCKYLYRSGKTSGSQTTSQGYLTRYEVSTLTATSVPDTIAMSGVQSTNNWAPDWVR